MQLVQRRHARGREATVIQTAIPPGDYHYIEESGKLYHFCYSNPESAAKTMAALQASWDELRDKLHQAQSQMRELLADGQDTTQVQQRIVNLKEAMAGRTERDRDLFLNFEDSPSECRVYAL